MILRNFVLLKKTWLAAPVYLAGLWPVLPGTEGLPHGAEPRSVAEAPHTSGSC